jgi:hypothetical protein
MGSRTMMQRRVAHAAAVTALFLAALLLAPRADAARLVPAKSAARATPRSRTPFKTAAALESGAPAAGPDATAPLEAGNATVVAAPEPLAALRVLALGDSITQGSVPSENVNHPYTLQLQKRLQAKLRRPADVTNAGANGLRRSLGALECLRLCSRPGLAAAALPRPHRFCPWGRHQREGCERPAPAPDPRRSWQWRALASRPIPPPPPPPLALQPLVVLGSLLLASTTR